MKDLLSRNRSAVLARIASACDRAGRSPSEVALLAVTKSVEAEVAAELFALGHADLAENRLEGLARKTSALSEVGLAPRWHFVGHVQRNKARKIARLAGVLHAVDTPELIDTLGRVLAEEGLRRDVYLQVKLAEEEEKHGLAPEEVPGALERAGGHDGLRVRGLMAMAPRPVGGPGDPRDADAARRTFARLRELARGLPGDAFPAGRAELSMGMSGDFELAIEEGSDCVRIGRALFEGIGRAGGEG